MGVAESEERRQDCVINCVINKHAMSETGVWVSCVPASAGKRKPNRAVSIDPADTRRALETAESRRSQVELPPGVHETKISRGGARKAVKFHEAFRAEGK